MIIEILENMEKAGSITLAEKKELINQYEYLRGRNIIVKYDGINIINQIRKTYWNNITFEDWFKPRYYITECVSENESMIEIMKTINQFDSFRCSQGYEILTRNQSIDNGDLTITTTYKKVKSYKEYEEEQEYEFRSTRANELELLLTKDENQELEPKTEYQANDGTVSSVKQAVSFEPSSHYEFGNGLNCMDFIKEAIKECKGIEGFYLGNAIKYLFRTNKKNGIDDLKKAHNYITLLLKEKGVDIK